LFEISGCTVPSSVTSGPAHADGVDLSQNCNKTTTSNGEETTEDTCKDITTPASDSQGSDDTKAFQAMAVFLLDFQAAQSINGEDDIETESTTQTSAGNVVAPISQGAAKITARVNDASYAAEYPSLAPHKGTDFSAPIGTPVYAVSSGTVTESGKGGEGSASSPCVGRGSGSDNIVTIQHDNGTVTHYWHMGGQDITVAVGDKVNPGQEIGKVNNCGQSYGAHLHLELEVSSSAEAWVQQLPSIKKYGKNWYDIEEYLKHYGVTYGS
jgi:murein DD-endopeptidase MepM/ murein hydrolase activator NlpD